MSPIERGIREKAYRYREDCYFVESELIRYIEILESYGQDINFSYEFFEDFLIYYESNKALTTVVSLYECQEIINRIFGICIDIFGDSMEF